MGENDGAARTTPFLRAFFMAALLIKRSTLAWARRRHGDAGDDRHGRSEPTYLATSRRLLPMVMESPDDFSKLHAIADQSPVPHARGFFGRSAKLSQPCDRTRSLESNWSAIPDVVGRCYPRTKPRPQLQRKTRRDRMRSKLKDIKA
jgi:hypothetical protein